MQYTLPIKDKIVLSSRKTPGAPARAVFPPRGPDGCTGLPLEGEAADRLGGPVGEQDDEDTDEPEEIGEDPVPLPGVQFCHHGDEVRLLLLDRPRRGLRLVLFLFRHGGILLAPGLRCLLHNGNGRACQGKGRHADGGMKKARGRTRAPRPTGAGRITSRSGTGPSRSPTGRCARGSCSFFSPRRRGTASPCPRRASC